MDRHKIACVEACESIEATTASLEAGLIGELNARAGMVPLLKLRVRQIEKQRDELLAAAITAQLTLRRFIASPDTCQNEIYAYEALREAINKVIS